MELEGSIHNGTVILDEPSTLPEGTRVSVQPVSTTPTRKPIASLQAIKEKLNREHNDPPSGPTLAELLAPIVGSLDLPPDASVNVDHYLYGHPKK